mmetsp:Transcript_32625/g.64921  ORF Transcript_32625/g.64921 Transcript_32625/m.64921 type:complete len:546 (-) Transcript_32625:116-1753(-)
MSTTDVTRRTNATKKSKKREDSEKDANKKIRRSRRREARQRQRIITIVAFVFSFVLLYSATRPKRSSNIGIDSARYQRGKALREAALRKMSVGKDNAEGAISFFRNKMRGAKKKATDALDGVKTTSAGMRYLDPRQLPPLPGEPDERYEGKGKKRFRGVGDDEWRSEAASNPRRRMGPKVDYTKHDYEYPDLVYEPPNDGSYPPLENMSDIFEVWGQDDLDSPPDTIVEVLQHFDYQDPKQVEAAIKYRDLELPFKMYNVPEVMEAGLKWTDEYVSSYFDGTNNDNVPPSRGQCQRSVDHFFAFHRPDKWDTRLLGPPPSTDVDWTFEKWAQHAVYADEVALPINKHHYYWQSGVPREERLQKRKHWTFVSRDLPSFSSPDPTFFGFNPPEQKGIQCRFGERGVTAATHYDGGRNMIAMMTGAKRYILSPPNACPKLGVVTSHRHPSYRHSMLNFGRVTLLDMEDTGIEMSEREREWLRVSGEAPTLSTVLKAGEVLYVPSHWFHYIISLQKSAQCNTRSGIHKEGNPYFGGLKEVVECVGEGDD